MTPSHVTAAHSKMGVLAFLLGHHASANKVAKTAALHWPTFAKFCSCFLAWYNYFHF